MKHSRQSLLILLLAATLAPQPSAAQKRVKAKSKTIVDTPIYKQASRPIEERVADLLSRMTIEEKIAYTKRYGDGTEMQAYEYRRVEDYDITCESCDEALEIVKEYA